MVDSWARIRITGLPWASWVRFPGQPVDQAEKIAMKQVADLIGWWEIRAEYEVSATTPMEE
jgi:hypothetical protein